jgi:hypothetical protein
MARAASPTDAHIPRANANIGFVIVAASAEAVIGPTPEMAASRRDDALLRHQATMHLSICRMLVVRLLICTTMAASALQAICGMSVFSSSSNATS